MLTPDKPFKTDEEVMEKVQDLIHWGVEQKFTPVQLAYVAEITARYFEKLHGFKVQVEMHLDVVKPAEGN